MKFTTRMHHVEAFMGSIKDVSDVKKVIQNMYIICKDSTANKQAEIKQSNNDTTPPRIPCAIRAFSTITHT